jgi:hypothetical protein
MVSATHSGRRDGARRKHWNLSVDEGALIVGLVFNVASFVLVTALSLAMSRDGSSGGTIRMADISEKGVERHFVPGNNLPVLSAKIV